MMRSVFLVAAVFMAFGLIKPYAAPITAEKASEAAAEFYSQRYVGTSARSTQQTGKTGNALPVVTNTSAILGPDDAPVGYLAECHPGGFVIIRVDDTLPPVKLHSEHATFDDMPAWFTQFVTRELAQELDVLVAQTQKAVNAKSSTLAADSYKELWGRLLDPQAYAKRSGTVGATSSSLAAQVSTSWFQDYPYNLYCPAVSAWPTDYNLNGHAPAGCVAVAMAQIMRKHEYPPSVMGVSLGSGYQDDQGTSQGWHAFSDAELSPYAWNQMPNSVSAASPESSIQAVAQLIYHCGVSVEMDYESSSSKDSTYGDASPSLVPNALRTHFGYDCSGLENRSPYSDGEWFGKIQTDIAVGNPIFYTFFPDVSWIYNIFYGSPAGHAVVVDGTSMSLGTYQIRINFGWGNHNPTEIWYDLNSIATGETSWNSRHAAIFGITPSAIIAPEALSASAVSSTQIDLVWTDRSSNETGFKVERRLGSSGTWSQIATTPANGDTYSDSGRMAGTLYQYRVRAYNAAGDSEYSDTASATTHSDQTVEIGGVSPSILVGLPLPQTQLIVISGAGFTSASRLTFNDGVNPPYTGRVPASWTPDELTYNIAVGVEVATWTVKVVNGEVESEPFTFYVVSGQTELTGLAISGPATINGGDSGQFTATAYFSDGSSMQMAPATWSVDNSYTTISTSGLLGTSATDGNYTANVTASYSFGRITRIASTYVTVVMDGSGSGPQTRELIVNGNFSQGDQGWDRSSRFYADNRFGNSHSPGGYAYLSNQNGTPGNNLYGEIAQYVDIPADADDVTLSFWYYITTQETLQSEYDTLTLLVLDGGGDYETIDTLSNLDSNSEYEHRSYDITYLRGQRVYIGFAAETDGSEPTTFRIDDVSILSVGPPPVTLSSLRLRGPSAVEENSTAQYTAIAVFSDGTTDVVAPDSWGESSPYASISSQGELTVGDIEVESQIGIWASYTWNGVTRGADKSVDLIPDGPNISHLYIRGKKYINWNMPEQYSATAVFSDGSSKDVTADAQWWSEQSWMRRPGEALYELMLNGDLPETITANYRGLSARYNVTIKDISSLRINGPNVITILNRVQYTATGIFDDGRTYNYPSDLTSGLTWTVDADSALGGLLFEFGLIEPWIIPYDVPFLLNVQRGSHTSSKEILVKTFDTIRINGPDAVNCATTVQYTATGMYSNGPSFEFPPEAYWPYFTWTVDQESQGYAWLNWDILGTWIVPSDSTAIVSVVFGSRTFSKPIVVKTFDTIRIDGPDAVNSATTAQYTVTGVYGNGATVEFPLDYYNYGVTWSCDPWLGEIYNGTINTAPEYDSMPGSIFASYGKLVGSKLVSVNRSYPLLVSAKNGKVTKSPDLFTYTNGSLVEIVAEPSPLYSFTAWIGQTVGCDISDNTIVVPMDRARAITALFSADQTINNVPKWWLFENGFTNSDWDAEALADPDGDGVPNWREYVNGTDPNTASEDFHFNGLGQAPRWTNAISWSSASNRWYSISRTTNLFAGFELIADAIAATPPVNYFEIGPSIDSAAYFSIAAAMVQPTPDGMTSVSDGPTAMGGTIETPLRPVDVGAYFMDKHEVTKDSWDEIYSWGISHGYVFDNLGAGKASTHPVQTVSWYDVIKWCNARSEKEGLTPCYFTESEQTNICRSGRIDIQNDWVNWGATGYRLPTEAEWEKAARGGTEGHRFPWSDVESISQARANYFSTGTNMPPNYWYDIDSNEGYHPLFNDGIYPFTSPVGSFAPNNIGIYDMAGNVWEWCWNWYSINLATGTDPRGPEAGSDRVIRGGAFNEPASGVRVANRNYSPPLYGNDNVGFRCVRGNRR